MDLDLWKYKDIILSKISLLDIVKKYNLELEEVGHNQKFSHRCKCPFHKEKTPSFFISQQTNSFFCFGCSKSGNPIDFISQYEGTPPIIVLKKLAQEIGIIKRDGNFDEFYQPKEICFDPSKTIEPYLINISSLIREYILQFVDTEMFDKEFKWIEKINIKLDNYLNNLGYEDFEDAKKIYDKLSSKIKNRLKLVSK